MRTPIDWPLAMNVPWYMRPVPAAQLDATEVRELRVIAHDAVAKAIASQRSVHASFHNFEVDVSVMIECEQTRWVSINVAQHARTVYSEILHVPTQ
jgi:hypothetical protein